MQWGVGHESWVDVFSSDSRPFNDGKQLRTCPGESKTNNDEVMQLNGEYTFNGPREEVWDLLQDPDVLKAAMPGAKKLEKIADDQYEAELQVRVGPVNGVFATTISLTDKMPPEQYTMLVDSKGPTGFAKGTARVTLTQQDANTTLMQSDATLQVGGRIASVGQRMIDTVSKSMTRQSLEAMNGALQAHLDAAAGEEPEETYATPTQAEFAREVAKDVAAETVKSRGFVVGLAIVAVIAVVIALLVF